jgi:hypothetical protein
VLVRHPTGPVSRQIRLEGLRLADAFKGSAKDIPDQQVDSLQKLAVVVLEPEVILPAGKE